MEYKKKLIEVALPLEAINEASAREKSIRHGHPFTLHLWWARRPLAAARAVIWSSLVDDPSSHPELFPTDEAQTKERERLFNILEKLVQWENTNNREVLDEAKAEILKHTNGVPPALFDPFAGGGSIPLEAQRLGLKAHASDLNPVAVMINKAMIEIPSKFAGQPPINPDVNRLIQKEWPAASGLAEDVRYYGEWLKKKAYERIGHLYPKVKDKYGNEHTVIAWIWARTVKCPNPACGCEMPLASSFALSKKKGKEAYVQPIIEDKKIRYEVRYGKKFPEGTIIKRKGAKCICCNTPIDFAYIREEGKSKRMKSQMIAIVAEGKKGRMFFSPNDYHISIANCHAPKDVPQSDLPEKALGINIKAYGFIEHRDLFTSRQLIAITTLIELNHKVIQKIISNGGSKEYAEAVSVYLGFLIDQIVNHSSSVCGWNSPNTQMRSVFSRQAIQMVWDYAECNIFSNSTGSISNLLERQVKGFEMIPGLYTGNAFQHNAEIDNGYRNLMISTDPPYYDNIGYADLSDFFYIWLRQSLKNIYPELFKTVLVPKSEELVANPFRFSEGTKEARKFFEEGMLKVFKQIFKYVVENVPVTVYYAFKQDLTCKYGKIGNKKNTSVGWETMLAAIMQAGFIINGTWPISTEKIGRVRENSSNALTSSIVLVCRKRPTDAPTTTRREFINALKRELKPALKKLQESNIAPVDMAQSAIGPGMGVYSRFSKVLEADGTPMNVRLALQIINQELDLYFTDQDSELDSDSRFCVDLYTHKAFNDVKFGEADVLARAKNTSVDKLAACGILYAQKGVVRLLAREEIPEKIQINQKNIWLLTQQLTYALEKEGVIEAAKIVADIYTSEPEQAKSLAYRLFTIAERRGWTEEAYAYNSLVISWPEVLSKAAELQSQGKGKEQTKLFEV